MADRSETEGSALLQRAERELTCAHLLSALAATSSGRLSVEAICTSALAMMHEHLPELRACSVHLVEDEERNLRLVASLGYPLDMMSSIRVLPISDATAAGRAAMRREAVTHESAAQMPESVRLRERLGLPAARWVSLPIVQRSRLLGVLTLYLEGSEPFTVDEVGLYRGVAAILGNAVDDALLLKQERRAARLSEALSRINETLLSSMDIEDVLQRVVIEVSHAAEADKALLVERTDDGHWLVRHAYRFDPSPLGKRYPAAEAPALEVTLRSGQPQFVEDATTDPRPNRAFVDTYGLGAFILFPIGVGDRLFGALSLGWEHPRTFSDKEKEFARRLSTALSLAIQKAQSFETRVQQARVADGTNRVLGAALRARSEEDLGEQCLRVALDVTGSTFGFIGEIARDGSMTDLAISDPGWEPCTAYAAPGHPRWPRDRSIRGLYGEVLTSRTPVLTNDPSSHPSARGVPEGHPPLRSFLGVPLPSVDGQRVLGMVAVANRPGGYRAEELGALRSIAPVISEAFERFRAERRLGDEARIARELNRLETVIHGTLDFDRIAEDALRTGCEILGADSASIGRNEPPVIRITHAFGFDRDVVGVRLPQEGEWHAVQAIRTRDIVISEDLLSDPHGGPRYVSDYGIRAGLLAPLILAGTVFGVVFFNFREPHRFTEIETRFVRRVAHSLSLAMENARLYSRERRMAGYAAALNRINEAVHSTLDTDEIMQRLVSRIAEGLEVESVAVHLRKHGRWRFAFTHGVPEEIAATRLTDEEAPLSTRAFRTLQPVVAPDVAEDGRANRPLMRRWGVATLIAVPLIVRGDAQGVLLAGGSESAADFDEAKVDFMQQAATTLGLALENARLYDTERGIANHLQEALLSLPDEVPGIDFAHAYHSATEATRVGGDFYDIFPLSHDHLGVVIGDVAGKGIDAAVLTSLVKNTIRAHAYERGKSAAKVLALTNEVVHGATPVEAFVTVFFGLLDCRDGRLVYASAGHTTGCVLRPVGPAGRLPATGPLLGAFPGAPFEQACTRLDPGDVLFLYTDGVTEARRGREQYGERRLFQLLSSMEDRSVRRVAHAVYDDVIAYSEGHLRDDVALLAVKRTQEIDVGPHQQKLDI